MNKRGKSKGRDSGRRVYIRTFGCQMNVHDSEKMLGILYGKGFTETDDPFEADLVIFNTCSIREKAEQKFFSELGRMREYEKRNPNLTIAVAGCIAQQEGRYIRQRAPYVDFVLGPQNIHILENIDELSSPLIALEDNRGIAEHDLPVRRTDGVRAWVTIMYGCNNYCSYCVVPFTRGRERSRPSGHVYSEVIGLALAGYKEITLLGQNVNSYRSDTDFPDLLRMLNGVEGIERIRFVTSHPKDLSLELITEMAELPKVCEHIHLPLQSGSDRILRNMNRSYTYGDYMQKVSQLRRLVPPISITTDIIAGFPGETDEDHRRTVEGLREIEFDGIFAFKYSPRPNTRAAEMPEQLREEIKSERLDEILSLQDEITIRKNEALEGTIQEIIVEGKSDTDVEKRTGRTRSNKIVNFHGEDIPKGSTVKMKILKGRKHSLEGMPLGR